MTNEKAASFHGPSGTVTVTVALTLFMQSKPSCSASGLSAAGRAVPPRDAGPPSVTFTAGSDDSAVGAENSCSAAVDVCRKSIDEYSLARTTALGSQSEKGGVAAPLRTAYVPPSARIHAPSVMSKPGVEVQRHSLRKANWAATVRSPSRSGIATVTSAEPESTQLKLTTSCDGMSSTQPPLAASPDAETRQKASEEVTTGGSNSSVR